MEEARSQPPAAGDDYITVGEASRLLHISAKSVNRWANEGRVPCIVTLGGHRRFRRADIMEIVAEMSRRGRSLPH